MNNFKPGGQKPHNKFLGGRPREDSKYGAKKSFGGKPSFGNDRGGSRGGDRGGFGGNRDGERREMTMHKATCSTCGKNCEVPFKPDGTKPVLCSECFGKNRSDDRNGVERRDRFSNDRPSRAPERKFDAPRPPRQDSPDYAALVKQVSALESKINQILDLIKAPAAKSLKPEVVANEKSTNSEIGTAAPKLRKPKKATVAKKVVKKAAKKATKATSKKK